MADAADLARPGRRQLCGRYHLRARDRPRLVHPGATGRREDGVTHIAYQARLTSFDPHAIPPDVDFYFVPSERCELASGAHVGVCGTTRWRRCFDDDDCVLADRVCRDDAPDDNACFREYEIPTAPGETPLALPGPLLRHSDGTIWFSGYWGGNYVGRFDPATETFQRFPLARPPGETSCDLRDCVCFPPEGSRERACSLRCCLYVVLGRGPWTLVEDDGGGVAFCAQEAGAVARLPRQRFRDPRCAALGATGANICMLEYPLLDYDPATTQLHSLALDGAGNLWFGESRIDGRDEDAARGASLGYVQAGTGDVILLPPLSLYPFERRRGPASGRAGRIPQCYRVRSAHWVGLVGRLLPEAAR